MKTIIETLSLPEIDAVAGGGLSRRARNAIDGGAALFGGGAFGYAASLGVLGAVGGGALVVGAVALTGYGIYRLTHA